MKKIFAFLLVFTLAATLATAWDIDGGISGASKYKIDMGLKNQIRHAYDNAFSVELILPVSDIVKLGVRVELDNDADNLDYTQSTRVQTVNWDKIDTEVKIGLGIKPTDSLEICVDMYGGAAYSEVSTDYQGAYYRQWNRNTKNVIEYKNGNSYVGFGVAIGVSGLPIDKLWIIQKVKIVFGEGFADGAIALQNALNTGATSGFGRDQFNYTGVEYDGTIKSGIPLHTMMNLDIAKLDVGFEYNYGIDYTGYTTAYVNGGNPNASSLYSNQVYGNWTGGRVGFDGLPSKFGTDHNLKINLGINYSNIETNVWVKPEVVYAQKSWKWKGVKPYQHDSIDLNFYVGSNWKVSIPAQTFFPCIVSFKLGAEWKIANQYDLYSDYTTSTSADGSGGFVDNEIYQAVKGTFEMEMNFNGVTATIGWSPDVYFYGEKDDSFHNDVYGGTIPSDAESGTVYSAGTSGVVVTDTNIFNLGIWKIGVSIEFDPIKKKSSAVEDTTIEE